MRQFNSKLSGLLMPKLLNRKTMFSNTLRRTIGKTSLLGLCLLLFTITIHAQTSPNDHALGFTQGDYVLVDNPADFNVGASTDFTIEMVIKSYFAGGTLQSLFTKLVEPNNPNQGITGYQLSTVNGRLAFEWLLNGSSFLKIESTAHVDDAQCHHVAVVVDRSGTNAKLYIDGVLDKDVTNIIYGQDIDNIAPVYIGGHQLLRPQNTWYGLMDEVAFFKSARTASEISRDAQFALTGTELDLVGYWKFDSGVVGADNTGVTTAIDQTGGNHGTLLNFDLTGTQIITNVPNGPIVVGTWVASECSLLPSCSTQDHALGFTQGDYVLVDNPEDFNVGASTDFTIQMVIKSYFAGGTLHSLFTKVVEPNNPNQGITGYQLSTVNGRLAFEWFNNGNSFLKIESTTHADDGQCHHVAVVVDRSGTNAKLYIDGVLDTDVTNTIYGQDIDNIAPVYIGAHPLLRPQNTWYGTMDEAAFFKSARTASEIARDAELALIGSEPGLTGYWKFDSGVVGADNTGATTAIDQTGGNNGTLLNFDLTGTQIITNVPNGPIVVGTWVDSDCSLIPSCSTQDNALGFSLGDYVLVDNPEDFNVGASTDFTIQMVIKSYFAGGTLQSLFTKLVEPNNPNQGITGYQLSTVNGRLAFEWLNNTSSFLKIESTAHVDDAQCHHVAVVVNRSGTNAKLYIDGVLDTDVTNIIYGQDIDNIAPVYIGGHQLLRPQNTWYGTMDEAAFFTSARTASEIAHDAELALGGTEPGLVAYWKFDSGVVGADNTGVTTAIDQTGGNNGTLLNFDLTGTQIITNVPNGPIVVGTWVASECPQAPGGNPPVIGPLSNIVLPGCDGTVVNYDFSSAVTSSTPVTITYNPASGSAFNLGSTPVTMTATNADGSDTETFNVEIQDNVDPTIALNGSNPVTLQTGTNYTEAGATANDNCGLNGPVQITGTVDVNTANTYTLTYTATDASGNTASTSRSVIVQGSPPVIGPLSNIVLPGCDGTVVNYDFSSAVTSSTSVTITYNPASGSAFNLGSTQVIMTATNADGSDTETFNVIIEDKIAPTVTPVGDNPQTLCQGDSYTENGATAIDNCSGNIPAIPSGSVDVNIAGNYTVTYTATDASGNTASAARTVIVKPLPAALVQDNCPNNKPICNQIRLNVCPYQYAPDLAAAAMSNTAYVAGASLSWYGFNGANNPAGSQLPGPPAIDMDAPKTTTNAWVTQTVDGCESAPTQFRVRVKADKDPLLELDFTGIALPTCGGATIDFLFAVTYAGPNVEGFRFYKGKPNQGGTLLTSTTGATVAKASDYYFYAPVANGTNDYYVQSVMKNGNQCGGEASDEVSLSVANPEITSATIFLNEVNQGTFTSFPISLPNVDLGLSGFGSITPLDIDFSTQNTAQILPFYIIRGITTQYRLIGSVNNNQYGNAAFNPNFTFDFRFIPYNGSCAGQAVDFTLQTCPTCRSSQPAERMYDLTASPLNRSDVLLNMHVKNLGLEFQTIEVQKEVAPDSFEVIQTKAFTGDGKYRFIDRDGMSELSRYRVWLITTDGMWLQSEIVEVRGDALVAQNEFAVYPNPTTDRIQVQALFPMEEAYSWQLTDMIGKTVMTGMMQESKMSLDLSRLPEGVYQFVTISREGARTVNRIVKQ